MNPLFLALGAGLAVYALARDSGGSTNSPARALFTYQMVRKLDWLAPDPGQVVTSASDAHGFYIIARDQTRGSYRAKVYARPRPDGFYDIIDVIHNDEVSDLSSPTGYRKVAPLDILPGDHGWLWVPKRDAAGKLVLDAKGAEIWEEPPSSPPPPPATPPIV